MYNNNTINNNPVLTCGVVIQYQNSYLMVKPSYATVNDLLSIPKGIINDGESELDCAIRETKEETGVDLHKYKDYIKHIGYYVYKHNRKTLSAFYIDITDITLFDDILGKQFKNSEFYCDSYTDDTNRPENIEIKLIPISMLLQSTKVHYTQMFVFNHINGVE